MQNSSNIEQLDEISDYVDQTSFSEQYSNYNSIDEASNDTISPKLHFHHIQDAPFKAIAEVPEINEASPLTSKQSDAYIKPKAVS